jgi:hypothetical protein
MAEDGQACVTRKRVRLQLTVHPLTDQRLEELAAQFASNKGRLVDKLVECLHAAYKTGRQHCISGKPCKVDLTDLPTVY